LIKSRKKIQSSKILISLSEAATIQVEEGEGEGVEEEVVVDIKYNSVIIELAMFKE
jgi:hypothetical protein